MSNIPSTAHVLKHEERAAELGLPHPGTLQRQAGKLDAFSWQNKLRD